ncbi:MAG: ferritin [Chloroflexaceae bacterium]|nr:ferritin [Chloroflexaceae bacterium]
MISQRVHQALNEQIAYEFHASFVYLSMAAYFDTQNLPGFARWMRVQSEEEMKHAMKFFDFILDRNAKVSLQALPQPPVDFASAEEVFQKALEHEQKVTGLINRIYQMAVEDNDYPTQVMLHWFIEEQVEEEKNVGQVLETVKMAENRAWSLLILDRQMGQREDEH